MQHIAKRLFRDPKLGQVRADVIEGKTVAAIEYTAYAITAKT